MAGIDQASSADLVSEERYLWERLMAHYLSDAALIPELARQHDVQLSAEVTETLYGAEVYNTGGLPRASLFIGKVINRFMGPESLFDQSEDSPYSVPSYQALENLANQSVTGPSGRNFFGLIRDALYPLDPVDNLIELPANSPFEATQTVTLLLNRRFLLGHKAIFCADSEDYFIEEGFDSAKLKPIEVAGRVVALQKERGDYTAVSTVPATLNGAEVPVGSLLTVETGRRGRAPKFGFGRLSLFNYANPNEAFRQLPELAISRYKDEERRDQFKEQLAVFNNLVGRSPATTEVVSPTWDDSLTPLLIGALEMALIVQRAEFSGQPVPLRSQQEAVTSLQEARLALATITT